MGFATATRDSTVQPSSAPSTPIPRQKSVNGFAASRFVNSHTTPALQRATRRPEPRRHAAPPANVLRHDGQRPHFLPVKITQQSVLRSCRVLELEYETKSHSAKAGGHGDSAGAESPPEVHTHLHARLCTTLELELYFIFKEANPRNRKALGASHPRHCLCEGTPVRGRRTPPKNFPHATRASPAAHIQQSPLI